jgi:hypothetical protein
MSVSLDGASTTLTLDSTGAVVVTGARDVTVSSAARLVLEGRTGVEIKGATVAVQAQQDVTVQGAFIRLN